jgi:hypothetical protein
MICLARLSKTQTWQWTHRGLCFLTQRKNQIHRPFDFMSGWGSHPWLIWQLGTVSSEKHIITRSCKINISWLNRSQFTLWANSMILKVINLEVFWFKIQTAAFLHPTRPISQHIYFVSQLNDTEGYQSWSKFGQNTNRGLSTPHAANFSTHLLCQPTQWYWRLSILK